MSAELSTWIDQLSAEDESARQVAAEKLSQLGEEARSAAVPLARAAGDQTEAVREAAVAALEGLGPPEADDLPALADLVGNPQADIGYWAATLIGRAGDAGAAAVPALQAALGERAPLSLRERAAWALGKIGPAASPALDELRRISGSDEPRLARLAAKAVEQITG